MASAAGVGDAALPASSTPHQIPESRRACQECNRKKAKCDRRRPMCGLCVRSGTSCSFPSQRKRPTRRKPQLKPQAREINDRVSTLVQILTGAARSGQGAEASTSVQDLPESSLRQFLQSLLEDVGNTSLDEAQADSRPNINEPTDQDLEDGDSDMEESNSHPKGNEESVSNPASDPGQPVSAAAAQSRGEITSGLAVELINLFFDNIQPWLPLLHKPRFLARMEEKLSVEGDVLRGLDADEALTLCTMFALAARFSNNQRFANVPPLERGDEFAELAAHAYGQSRLSSNPPFTHIQGCILLAFYFYTSGPNKQGWILIGVCIRLAYIMGLSEIDDEEWVPPRPLDAVEKEELRRAWWLVWELDAFASMTFRKPFSIDRKRMAVKLPISDKAWFAEMEVDSAEMITTPGQCWKSLQGSPNQDARTWFLLASHCVSNVLDRLQQRHKLTLEDKVVLENEVACFKVALPPALRLHTEPLEFTASTFATSNWIIGIHIMLMATSFMISGTVEADPDVQSPASGSGSASSTLPIRQRAITLSRILSQWDAKYIPLSHPILSCLIVAPFIQDSAVFSCSPLVASSHDLSKLVLSCFAENWKLACIAEGLLGAVGNDSSSKEDDKKRTKGNPIFFGFPPFSIANTPSIAESHEQESPSSTANGRHHARNSSTSGQSQQQMQQHRPQPPGRLQSSEGPTYEQVEIPSYRASPFGLEGLPPVLFNIDGISGDNSAFLEMFDGYQETDFMQAYPWMNSNGPSH